MFLVLYSGSAPFECGQIKGCPALFVVYLQLLQAAWDFTFKPIIVHSFYMPYNILCINGPIS